MPNSTRTQGSFGLVLQPGPVAIAAEVACNIIRFNREAFMHKAEKDALTHMSSGIGYVLTPFIYLMRFLYIKRTIRRL